MTFEAAMNLANTLFEELCFYGPRHLAA